MRIHIMGSAAAEGWPAVFCRCEPCRRARQAGGKNVRSRSGALVDGIFKFDWPADTYMQALRDGLDMSEVRHLIVTHTHGDHWYPTELIMHRRVFAHDFLSLDVWGDAWVVESARGNAHPEGQISVHRIDPGDTVEIGDARVEVLKAAHYPQRICHNYIFEREGKTLFYGQDCGPFPDAHWAALKKERLDAVILDCTSGPRGGGSVHGNIEIVSSIAERLRNEGIAHDATRIVANHFSHNGELLHEELEKHLTPHGVEVSYDGMVVEV